MGGAFDRDPPTPRELSCAEPRSLLAARIAAASVAREYEAVRILRVERGLLSLAIADGPGQPFGPNGYSHFLYQHRMRGNVALHARERVSETKDPAMRVHYLEFLLARGERTATVRDGLVHETLAGYREYVTRCTRTAQWTGLASMWTQASLALERFGDVLRRAEGLQGDAGESYAHWLVGLADLARPSVAGGDESVAAGALTRSWWVTSTMRHLLALPATAVAPVTRGLAYSVLRDAGYVCAATEADGSVASARLDELSTRLLGHWRGG
jgi:hypothetical protein